MLKSNTLKGSFMDPSFSKRGGVIYNSTGFYEIN
jgi:hypothetical protein